MPISLCEGKWTNGLDEKRCIKRRLSDEFVFPWIDQFGTCYTSGGRINVLGTSPRDLVWFCGAEDTVVAPRWMDRPDRPGRWLCVNGDLPDCAVSLTQEMINKGAPFASKRVYGPIPEDK